MHPTPMNDDQLDQLLKSCGTRPTPPGFHSAVWQRIAAGPQSVGWMTRFMRLVDGAIGRLSQPHGALAACAASIAAGVLIGLGTRGESQPPELEYIRSVSPFLHQTDR